jgi:hypothetical protein
MGLRIQVVVWDRYQYVAVLYQFYVFCCCCIVQLCDYDFDVLLVIFEIQEFFLLTGISYIPHIGGAIVSMFTWSVVYSGACSPGVWYIVEHVHLECGI